MTTKVWSNSTGWASLTRIALTVPGDGAIIGFITFIASTMSKVSPVLTLSPTATNGFEPGSGERKAVPTIGDLTGVPAIGSGASEAASAIDAAGWGPVAEAAGTGDP